MSTTNKRTIALSNVKMIPMIVGAFVFVAIGLWMATQDVSPVRAHGFLSNNPALVHAAGIAAVVFFAACGLFGIVKLFDREPGLILDDTGFVHNSTAAAAGFVPWDEVTGVSTLQISRQRLLVVKLRDPERYIRQVNRIRQAMKRGNQRMCGSPIAIASNALKIDFDELSALFNAYWSQHDKAPA